MSGMEYLNGLEAKDYRITWIDDGTVLFDNAVNANEMENHLEREEIKEALADGYGESVRYSNTLSDKQLYSSWQSGCQMVLYLGLECSNGSLGTAFGIFTADLPCDPDCICFVLCACIKAYKANTDTNQRY